MAYRKVTKSLNLPLFTGDDAGAIPGFLRTLVSVLIPFITDITSALNDLIGGYVAMPILQKQTAAPSNPVSGMIVYADGTSWNPGSGEGFYGYYNSGWHFLG